MIGIFDSGAGGLMVFHYLSELLPEYDYVYLGDQAHVPYGPRSSECIQKLTEQHVQTLFEKGAKIVLIACNSATTAALRYLQQKMKDKKILGVVIPAAEEAIFKTKNGIIGVVGTEATIRSRSYETEIKKEAETQRGKQGKHLSKINVYQKACPLLVPLIEEGWSKKPETRMILKKYLYELKSCHIDTLVLGCTHYAVLEKEFQKIVGKRCAIVNSAKIQAESFVKYLTRHPEIDRTLGKNGKRIFYTTDCPEKFLRLGTMFLQGKTLDHVKKI